MHVRIWFPKITQVSNRLLSLIYGLSAMVLLITLLFNPVLAQTDTSVHLQRKVVGSNGNYLPKSHETASSFTVFLNSDQDTILTDQSPFWDSNQKTINLDEGSNYAAIELGNFTSLESGDTAVVRFTDVIGREQGIYRQEIGSIPWSDPAPLDQIQLSPETIPRRPVNVSLQVNNNHQRTLTWDAEAGLTYHVYRRSRTDTVSGGKTRYQYTKIAGNLDTESFTDTNTDADAHFGYIVYAENNEGVLSRHSKDAVVQNDISGLTAVDVKTKNITLAWDSVSLDLGRLAGYNIYRRTENSTYDSEPLAYSSPDTHYTDTRLEPGQTYYYQIRPRNMEYREVGSSTVLKVTTESSGDYTSYANLKTAIVIYRHSNDKDGGDYTIPQKHVNEIKEYLEIAKEFIWRNSKMRFNIEFDYLILDEYTRIDPNDTIVSTARHLRDLFGVANEQYDFIYRIAASNSGYWSATSTPHFIGILPGSDRETGFSKIHWTMPRWMRFGWDLHPENETASWQIQLFIHEGSHAFDGIFNTNGFETFGHADHTYQYVYPYGNQYPDDYTTIFGSLVEFEAALFRDFDHFKDLKPNWGDIYQAPDRDGDGFPDRDSRVAFDEKRFGSSPTASDTDGDGLPDKKEATNSILRFYPSDPNNPDTDGDGIQDGDDVYPRYAFDTRIKDRTQLSTGPFKPTIDGDLSDWPKSTQIADTAYFEFPEGSFAPKIYLSYDRDSLYFAADLQAAGKAIFQWDFDDNGFYVGKGNTQMIINMGNGTFTRLRSKDHSREYVDWQLSDDGNCHRHCGSWDGQSEYQDHFGRRIVPRSTVNMETNTSDYNIEMAIAKNDLAGLTLEEGSRIGLEARYEQVDNESKHYAAMTDYGMQAYFTFGETTTYSQPDEPIAKNFKLQGNYPNPFNPTTTIKYTLPKSTQVELTVYNTLGREVTKLVDQRQAAGFHQATFDASNLSSGVYLFRIQTNSHSKTGKMLFVK